MLSLRDATIAIGGDILLDEVDFDIHPGERIGIIGPNGSGKTTLLRTIVGDHDLEGGTRSGRKDLVIGYLAQGTVEGSAETVWDAVQQGMTRIAALEAKVVGAREAVERNEPGAVEALGAAEDAFSLAGGYARDERVGEMLHGLGFAASTWRTPCSELSGGWQVRVALARTLLSDADLLILDEPTNHLDIRARSFVASLLTQRDRTALVVSHDRHLLEVATNRTVELRGGRMISFRGKLSTWLKERANRDALVVKQEAARKAEIARLDRFTERFGAKATKAAAAKSKQKQADKLRAQSKDLPPPEARVVVRLPEAPPAGTPLVAVRGDLGWTEPILRGVDIEVHPGMRVALLGINGSGKSTLLAAMSGRHAPLTGRALRGDGVRVGWYAQDVAESLPKELEALTWLQSRAPRLTLTATWALLGAMGLGGVAAKRPIGSMSGGERARVALASLCARPHNLLLLDEPSNHLDVVTIEVLAAALAAFEGGIVFATHDRYLVEQVATHVVEVAGGVAKLIEGNDIPQLERRQRDATAASGDDYAERKRLAREKERARKRVDKLGRLIEKAEKRMIELDAEAFEVAADFAQARKVETERNALQAEVDAWYAEWEALEE
jgi:ATP-binding cassette, subfamily F, member 3